MKFMHLSDLHLGKNLNSYNLIEDQKFILDEILKIADDEKIDGVFLSGDIYDKSIGSTESVSVLNSFLESLVERELYVFIISGNHDNAQRLSFGNKLFEKSLVYISSAFDENTPMKIGVEKNGQRVNVYLLPFIRPSDVRYIYPDENIQSYTDALDFVLNKTAIDERETNILLTHQAVFGASRCDSENKFTSIGTTDIVPADIFDKFDYVALGHIHTPQNIVKGKIRYCGTPLKYSFSESKHEKSVTIVNITENKKIEVSTVPLKPLRDLVELKGTYDELTFESFYENTSYREDYVHITLTDDDEVYDAKNKMQIIYRNLMSLDYDNKRTRSSQQILDEADELIRPFELFDKFFEDKNGKKMREKQKKIMVKLIDELWEENE